MRLAAAGRIVAIAIAVLGVIDPAVETMSADRPVVALLVAACDDAAPCAATALGDRIAQTLESAYRVAHGPHPDAVATIVAGAALPPPAAGPEGPAREPAFAVVPDAAAVRIDRIDAPLRAHLDSRVPIRVRAALAPETRGTITAVLSASGVVFDRVSQELDAPSPHVDFDLTFTPIVEGAVRLRLEVTTGAAISRGDIVVDVVNERHRIHFGDRRPSWLSTFVRREIEQDSRFAVTFRTRTSSNIATLTTGAPSALDVTALDDVDVVVAGAADAITRDDATALAAFAGRGGTVLLLVDAPPSAAMSAMTGTSGWSAIHTPEPRPLPVSLDGAPPITSSELYLPAVVPPLARVLASIVPSKDAAAERPAVFEAPLGLGRVMVFGAADHWRSRATAAAAFANFWRTLMTRAATLALRPIELRLDRTAARPGDAVVVTATLRDLRAVAPSDEASAAIAATLEGPDRSATPLRLWPSGAPGAFRGSLDAPAAPGLYRIRVTAAGAASDTPLLVGADVAHLQRDDRDALEQWTRARGGRVMRSDEIAALPQALAGVIIPNERPATWHPMRSAWWIVPFTIALGVDWARRRRATT